MRQNDRIDQLTLMARKIWEQEFAWVDARDNRVEVTVRVPVEQGWGFFQPIIITHPRALDAVEAALRALLEAPVSTAFGTTRERVADAETGEWVWVVLDAQGHHPHKTCPCFGCGQKRASES